MKFYITDNTLVGKCPMVGDYYISEKMKKETEYKNKTRGVESIGSSTGS